MSRLKKIKRVWYMTILKDRKKLPTLLLHWKSLNAASVFSTSLASFFLILRFYPMSMLLLARTS